MFSTIFAIHAGAAYGLGGYNIARFLVVRGIKARRRRKADRALRSDIKAAADYARNAYTKLKAGDIDQEKIADVIAYVKSQVK